MTWTTPAGQTYTIYKDMLSQAHLLIAGTTGSGKSVVLNALICTTLYKSPAQVGFVLCDPKMVELAKYSKLPHTLKYADTLSGIASALEWAHGEMMFRFREMKRRGQVETSEKDIYIFIDEFANLVCKGPDRTENKIRATCEQYIESIGKLGRAAHMHLIMATQAPNRQTLKANILLNMTARLALRCLFPIESRQIIGIPDAVNLPDPMTEHRAEGIYQHGMELERYHIPMIPQDETNRLINWWMDQKPKGFLWRLFS